MDPAGGRLPKDAMAVRRLDVLEDERQGVGVALHGVVAEDDVAVFGPGAGGDERAAGFASARWDRLVFDFLEFDWPPITLQFENGIVSDEFIAGDVGSGSACALGNALEFGEVFGINF